MTALLLNSFINALFPSVCPICNKSSDSYRTAPICSNCFGTLSRYNGDVCLVCANILPGGGVCLMCKDEPPAFSRTLAYAHYKGVLKEAIHQFKFSCITRFAYPIGSLINELEIPDADVILSVPLTRKRLKERGFNQSLLMARLIGKKRGIRLSYDGLVKVRETGRQSLLSAAERRTALVGAFTAGNSVSGKRVIVVDDVMTTGSTLNECAKALRAAGAIDVTALVAARTVQ